MAHKLKIDILTLFPKLFPGVLSSSILKIAQAKKKALIRVHDIRDNALDRHRTCDDRPYGGGPGMVMKPEPIDRAALKVCGSRRKKKDRLFIYLTPQGRPFSQDDAVELAGKRHLIFLCGHYEGVDERIVKLWADREVSVGDYILSGGELPALLVIDSVVRLLGGVLGNEASKNFESFTDNLLEYPQYTRPQVFRGLSVPRVLLEGNHKAVDEWRCRMSLKKTKECRADLLKRRIK